MAQQVLDGSNIQHFLETGKVTPLDALKEPPKEEAKPEDKGPPEVKAETEELEPGDEALSEAVRKRIGKEVFKRKQADAAVKKAEAARQEADSFAQNEYRRAQEAQKRADEAEARVKELEKRVTPPADTDKEPVREDFESDAAYWDAKIDWKADQKVKAAEKARLAQEQERANQARDEARIARNKAFAATVDDWEETAGSLAESFPEAPPGYIQEFILDSDMSAQVMYHFGKNPDDYRRIVALSPIKAVAELGKLEKELSTPKDKPVEAPKAEKAQERPRAPEPIKPLEGNSGAVHKPLSEMTTKETIEYWRAHDQKMASRRQRH